MKRPFFTALLGRYNFDTFIRWLAAGVGFFLVFRKGGSGRLPDALLVLLGLVMIADRTGMELLRQNAGRLKRLAFILCGVVFFVVLAELVNSGGNIILGAETYTSHIRLVFSVYAFFAAAMLAARGTNNLRFLSMGILCAPLVILPAYGNLQEGVFISGGRLSGNFQNPIIFGAWMLVTFVIGLGVMMSLRKSWQRALLFPWLVVLANFILWSASRAAWIALVPAVIAFILYFIRKNEFRSAVFLPLVVTVAFALGSTFLPHEVGMKRFVAARAVNLTESIVTLHLERIGSQNHSMTVPNASGFVLRHPLGTGFASVVPARSSEPAERVPESNNSLLEIATYGGLCALFLFVFLLIEVARRAWGVLWERGEGYSESDRLSVAWIIAGGAFLMDIFFTQAFLWRHTWFIIGAVTGVAYLKTLSAHGTSALSTGHHGNLRQ
ncbi:MAG: hypothetical protein RL681_618 [Candidatus Parcubacteria bacterium]